MTGGRSIATALTVLAVISLHEPSRAQARTAAQLSPPTVAAADLVGRAAAGEAVSHRGVTVVGDVDLQSVGTVTGLFRCQSCRFTGSFRAADVVFDKVLELRDSSGEGGGSTVQGDLDLTGATFNDRASFDGTTVMGAARVVAARFLGGISLRRTSFRGPVAFDETQVAREALFTESTFGAEATFNGATFEAGANFFRATFVGDGAFEAAIFRGPVNFFLAVFGRKANFDRAELGAGGNFRAAHFDYEGETPDQGEDQRETDTEIEVKFDNVHSAGPLDFDGATFADTVSFTQFASSGPVSLEGIVIEDGEILIERNFSVGDLEMDVESVKKISGSEENVLKLIERSAQRRGDLSVANDARYELLSLQGKTRTGVWGFLDTVFYRGLSGYLVRPLHPFAAFLALLMACTAVRSVRRFRRARAEASSVDGAPLPASPVRGMLNRSRRGFLLAEKAVTVVLAGLADSLGVAFRRKPNPPIEVGNKERARAYFFAFLKWGEFLAYKVLIAVSILAVGNSSATIRQVIDAVR